MKNKQTLEQAAINATKIYATNIYVNEREKEIVYLSFIEGAKWQAEKMYSENELKQAFLQGQESMGRDEIEGFQKTQPFEKWFEQFKK